MNCGQYEKKVCQDKDGLCYEYGQLFSDRDGWKYFRELEKEITYLTKDETTVKIYGRCRTFPRKVVAYGNEGLTYSFSGISIAAKTWTPLLLDLKNNVEKATAVGLKMNCKRAFTENTANKRLCVEKLTMDTIPDNYFHLGQNVFVTVSSFMKQTRVHIRHYNLDNGILKPTKSGVSLTPKVWTAFTEKLSQFKFFKDIDQVLVVLKDVCIFNHSVKNESVRVSVQRMYQRRDGAFMMVPERVELVGEQIRKLNDLHEPIMDCIKTTLIRYTLCEFVKQELMNPDLDISNQTDNWDPEDPGMMYDTSDSIIRCLKDFIAQAIFQNFECDACAEQTVSPGLHSCLNMSMHERFELYFQSALFTLDWHRIASSFIAQNMWRTYFRNFVLSGDFFECLDVMGVYKKVETLYVNDTSTVFASLEF